MSLVHAIGPVARQLHRSRFNGGAVGVKGWKAASPLSGRDYSKLTFVHFPTRRQCVCNAHRFVTVDDVKRICQELEPIVLLQDA